MGSIPGSGRCPGEGNGNPLQYSLPGESHGQRSLMDYSSWGQKSQTWLLSPTFPSAMVKGTLSYTVAGP